MTTHHHFLAAILCDLGSPTPVLLLADWLEEEGESGAQWWRELAEALGAVRILGPEPEWAEGIRGWATWLTAKGEATVRSSEASYNLFLGIIHLVERDEFGSLFVQINQQRTYLGPRTYRDNIIKMRFDFHPSELEAGEPAVEDVISRLRQLGLLSQPRPASATLPLSRLAAGVRQRLGSHPDT